MRQCNYCSFVDLKSRYSKQGMVVEVMPDMKNGGVNVYVRNPNDKLDTRSPDDGNKQWKVWYMELPSECVC